MRKFAVSHLALVVVHFDDTHPRPAEAQVDVTLGEVNANLCGQAHRAMRTAGSVAGLAVVTAQQGQ